MDVTTETHAVTEAAAMIRRLMEMVENLIADHGPHEGPCALWTAVRDARALLARLEE